VQQQGIKSRSDQAHHFGRLLKLGAESTSTKAIILGAEAIFSRSAPGILLNLRSIAG